MALIVWGLNVAMLCFSVEIVGLLLVGLAETSPIAKVGTFFAGAGFHWSSLRWGGGGEGGAAAKSGLGAGDLYGIYGSVFRHHRAAGRAADGMGRDFHHLSGGGGLVAVALLLSWRLKHDPGGGAGGRYVRPVVTG